jgi:RND family efflux transporter MFP subunit
MSIYGRRLGPVSAALLFAVLLAILVFGVTALRAEAVIQADAPRPLAVSAAEIRFDPAAATREAYPGLVVARRESALGFERGGRLETVIADIGDRVEAGDVLARLDTRALRAQIAAADAQTAEADAQVALARDTQARQATLLERGHISQQRFDETATQTLAAAARRDAAAAAADALRVELDLAVMTAPFDGVVTARLADEGAIAAPGQPLFTLVEAEALEIRVGLPAEAAALLSPGEAYPFEIEGLAAEASFRAATGVVERQTRTVSVVFDIALGEAAQAGQIARLLLDAPVGAEGFWAPTAALAESRRGLWSIYVLTPESGGYVLEPRVVEAVRVEAERVFVRGAVEEGELFLTAGLQRVTPGQRVTPVADETGASSLRETR